MKKFTNKKRQADYAKGLSFLNNQFKDEMLKIESAVENGEGLFSDEAAVWKRVLNLRIAKQMKNIRLFERHPGRNVNTLMLDAHNVKYTLASIQNSNWIDIDPYGFPYEFLSEIGEHFSDNLMLTVTSGEIVSVVRNLKNTKFDTNFYGRTAWKYIIDEYIPFVENTTGMQVRGFYAFPTSVRLIVSNLDLDYTKIFKDCPK